MRIATWNINSVRLRLDLVLRALQDLAPDVLCLQETKVTDDLFPAQALAAAGYLHQALTGMKGYNGVAIVSRLPLSERPSRIWCGKQDCRHLAVALPDGTVCTTSTCRRAETSPTPTQIRNLPISCSSSTKWQLGGATPIPTTSP